MTVLRGMDVLVCTVYHWHFNFCTFGMRLYKRGFNFQSFNFIVYKLRYPQVSEVLCKALRPRGLAVAFRMEVLQSWVRDSPTQWDFSDLHPFPSSRLLSSSTELRHLSCQHMKDCLKYILLFIILPFSYGSLVFPRCLYMLYCDRQLHQ